MTQQYKLPKQFWPRLSQIEKEMYIVNKEKDRGIYSFFKPTFFKALFITVVFTLWVIFKTSRFHLDFNSLFYSCTFMPFIFYMVIINIWSVPYYRLLSPMKMLANKLGYPSVTSALTPKDKALAEEILRFKEWDHLKAVSFEDFYPLLKLQLQDTPPVVVCVKVNKPQSNSN